ncbi:reticulon-like protein B9 [Diospyros lotus]|uniref:reticulon-like protein B9 n=1 Tax=Diospyros lotus TaxID=55363 RepID=UPI00224EF716|nr:reticulon-like protein B9 [Diospyros lotus]
MVCGSPILSAVKLSFTSIVTMPNHTSSDSDDERMGKNFGRERPVHDILGGRKVADVLLWRDKRVSAAILLTISTIWFLFEVVEYNFVTLLCHITITTMLLIFIWCMGADIFKWPPPRIPDVILDDSSFREVAAVWHAKLNHFFRKCFDVACGNDFRHFILALGCLWIVSVIGNYVSTLNLLFVGCVSLLTLPYLYERYEEEVDHLVGKANRQIRKSYKKFDAEVLRKIPRGPVKEKKAK